MTRIIFVLPLVSIIIHKELTADDPTQRKPVITLAEGWRDSDKVLSKLGHSTDAFDDKFLELYGS